MLGVDVCFRGILCDMIPGFFRRWKETGLGRRRVKIKKRGIGYREPASFCVRTQASFLIDRYSDIWVTIIMHCTMLLAVRETLSSHSPCMIH